MQTAERVSQTDMSDNYVFQRSLLAYYKAAEMVSGDILEIGTGSGYGIEVISPKALSFLTVDKNIPPVDIAAYPNVEYSRMQVPPLEGVATDSFDFVITFQVIEHIKDDAGFLAEIKRVLKPGGKLIVTTPNKLMSLSRNPWHIREYTPTEFSSLLGRHFGTVEACGVFGNEKVAEYYANNKESVQKIARYDIFGFMKWAPRWVLRIPYDILNRYNRRKLLKADTSLASGIRMEDYSIGPVAEDCFDLFYVAEK